MTPDRAARRNIRDQRSLMYARAKREPDQKAFGTELDVYGSGYTWINHSIAPREVDPLDAGFRVFGGSAGSKGFFQLRLRLVEVAMTSIDPCFSPVEMAACFCSQQPPHGLFEQFGGGI